MLIAATREMQINRRQDNDSGSSLLITRRNMSRIHQAGLLASGFAPLLYLPISSKEETMVYTLLEEDKRKRTSSYSSATAPDFHRLPYSAAFAKSGHLMTNSNIQS